MTTALRETTSIETEPDSTLLLIVVAGDGPDRQSAAEEFYKRHHKAVYEFCRRFMASLGGEDGVKDLVHLTIQRAFERADSYNPSNNGDSKSERAQTTQWLFKIAHNLFKDFLKSAAQSNPIPLSLVGTTKNGKAIDGQFVPLDDEARSDAEDADALALFSDSGSNDNQVSIAHECLEQALLQLTDREREIVLISASYDSEKQLRLPKEILDGICSRWKTSAANVRAIRRRAMESIRKYAKKHCPSCFTT